MGRGRRPASGPHQPPVSPRKRLRRLRRALRRYVAESVRRRDVPSVGWLELIRDLRPWYRSQRRSTLDLAQPWMTFEATRILEHELSPESRVFEFGAGGSTLFLGRRAAQVVTVEHDPAWYAMVNRAVAGIETVELVLAEPRPVRDEADMRIASVRAAFAGRTFADYVAVIDRYPDRFFDAVVIDGRARVAAFQRAANKVRIGGMLVLDDSERPAYGPIVAAATAAGWKVRGRLGPKPFTRAFTRTSIWTKTRELPTESP